MFGFPLAEIKARTGVQLGTIYRHAHGISPISPRIALKYHDALGIPLSSMRPDIWRPDVDPEAAEKALGHGCPT